MSNGYLIPENAQPAGIRCLRVFVPDAPLYIAAFLGALTYFGQWTAWERDEQKRGQFAAQAWREANELTIDGLSMPCSDNTITDDEMSEILDKLNDVISRLTEIEDMNITVTQTNSGCCCDGTDTGSTSQVSNMVIDPNDDGIIPPYDTDPVDVINITKCRAANYLARMVTETIRALAGRLGGGMLLILGIAEVLIAILSWIDLIPGDEVVGSVIGLLGLITIAQAIARMAGTTVFTWGVLDELAERLESPDIASGFVCALYNFNNASELGAALSSFLQSQVNQLDTDSFVKDAMIDVFDLLFDARIINWYVQNIGSIVPADFVAPYGCLCGATGDSCPTQNIVLAGLGNFPAGDLTGTTQGFASEFNSQTGYHEIIFELSTNYCVTIDNGSYTPTETHEKCAAGVMVSSDGSCIRRFVARSLSPFATAVEFKSQTIDCVCLEPQIACINMQTQSGVDGIEYEAIIDDTNEVWAADYRLRVFGGVTSAIVNGAILQISLTNPRSEQTGTVISIGLRNSGVWEYHEIVTAAEIGSGGLFPVSFPDVSLNDVFSGDVQIRVKNSSTQPMDVIPPQEIRFGTLCLHGNQ